MTAEHRPRVLRSLLARRRRVLVALWLLLATAAGLLAWDLGLDAGHALLLGAVVLGAGILQLALPDLQTPELPEPPSRVADGVRQDVASLAFAMRGEKGMVREPVVLRLRELAARRLAAHGLDLADPADADRVAGLLGPAARALTALAPRLSRRDVAACLDTLDALARRAAPGTPAAGTPVTSTPATDTKGSQ